MSRDYVEVPPVTTPGKKLEAEKLNDGSQDVYRETVQIGGRAVGEIADVTNSAPGGGAMGMVVRIAGGVAAATEYTEDAAAPADPVGGILMARRRNTPAVETNLDGDITALNATGKGELYVHQIDQPLPTGAATEASLVTANAHLAAIETSDAASAQALGTGLDDPFVGSGFGTIVAVLKGLWQQFNNIITVRLASGGATQPVSMSSAPLPAGAATAAKQDTGNTSLGNLETKIGEVQASPTANTVLGRLKDLLSLTVLAAGANLIGKVKLRNPGDSADMGDATTPVRTDPTGSTTQPVSASALPLPTGAATGAKQDTGNTSLGNLETKIGEVQASPTANTVLGRLKDLLTGTILAAGSAIIGKVGIDQTTPGTTNLVQATPTPRTPFFVDAVKATVTQVKGTAGTLAGWTLYNPNTSVVYVQVYDVASGTTVTLGTTVPTYVIPLPPLSASNEKPPTTHANGIKFACTTTPKGSTNPTSGVNGTIFYS